MSESNQMTLNTSESWEESLANSSEQCGHDMSGWEQRMEKMYTYFYLVVFIPGLLLNTTALWVLCKHIRYTYKHTKASNKFCTWLTLLHVAPQ